MRENQVGVAALAHLVSSGRRTGRTCASVVATRRSSPPCLPLSTVRHVSGEDRFAGSSDDQGRHANVALPSHAYYACVHSLSYTRRSACCCCAHTRRVICISPRESSFRLPVGHSRPPALFLKIHFRITMPSQVTVRLT